MLQITAVKATNKFQNIKCEVFFYHFWRDIELIVWFENSRRKKNGNDGIGFFLSIFWSKLAWHLLYFIFSKNNYTACCLFGRKNLKIALLWLFVWMNNELNKKMKANSHALWFRAKTDNFAVSGTFFLATLKKKNVQSENGLSPKWSLIHRLCQKKYDDFAWQTMNGRWFFGIRLATLAEEEEWKWQYKKLCP